MMCPDIIVELIWNHLLFNCIKSHICQMSFIPFHDAVYIKKFSHLMNLYFNLFFLSLFPLENAIDFAVSLVINY